MMQHGLRGGAAPVMRWRLAPSVFFSSFSFLKVAKAAPRRRCRRPPALEEYGSPRSHLEPKLDARSVSVSFVCRADVQARDSDHAQVHQDDMEGQALMAQPTSACMLH